MGEGAPCWLQRDCTQESGQLPTVLGNVPNTQALCQPSGTAGGRCPRLLMGVRRSSRPECQPGRTLFQPGPCPIGLCFFPHAGPEAPLLLPPLAPASRPPLPVEIPIEHQSCITSLFAELGKPLKVESSASGLRLAGFKSTLISRQPAKNSEHFSPLCLSFHTCETGVIVLPTSWWMSELGAPACVNVEEVK